MAIRLRQGQRREVRDVWSPNAIREIWSAAEAAVEREKPLVRRRRIEPKPDIAAAETSSC